MPPTPTWTRLVRNTLALVAGGMLAQIAFVSVEALIARRIGVEAYGTFAAVYASALLMVHVLDLGMNWKMLQDGSRNPHTLSDNLGTTLLVKFGLFLVAYPLALIALRAGGATASFIGAFAIFAFFALSMMIQDAFATVFASHQRMGVIAIFQAAVPVAMLLAVLVVVTPRPTLQWATLACVLGSLVVTAAWARMTLRVAWPTFSPRRILPMLRQSFYYGVSVSVHALYFRLGVLTLTLLRSATEVALFAAAYKLLELGFKIPTLASRVVAPKLFEDAFRRPREFRTHAALILRLAAFMSGLLGLLLFVAGPDVVTLVFGAAFESSRPVVQILACSLALKSIALLAQTLLSTADDHVYRSRADVATTAFGVVLTVVLTGFFGLTGTAVAVAVGDLLWSVLMVGRGLRHLPAAQDLRIVLLPMAAAVVGGVVAMQLPLGFIVDTLIAVTLFGLLLLASGYLRPLIEFGRHRMMNIGGDATP
jgi:O-antigen/teichoic acid export membrane protein